MTRPRLAVDHPSQLNALSTLPGIRPLQRLPISLGGSLMDHPKRRDWEEALNKNYLACACSASSTGLLVGIAAGLLLLVGNALNAGEWPLLLQSSGLVAGLAVAGAIAGKLIGLSAANRRLKAAIIEVQANWKVDAAKTDLATVCG